MGDWDQVRIIREIMGEADKDLAEVAAAVERDAKASTAFKDKTGTLRKSIKKQKSRYPNGGWIVKADAPHAHLIEYGHGGKNPAPAHPFLRPARDKNISYMRKIMGAK